MMMHIDTCDSLRRRLARSAVRNPDLAGDRITWPGDAHRKQHEDVLCAWLSSDEVASYGEEDAQLKTEEQPEEEDEKEREEHSGMSTASVNKLQSLWDHFIHAEPQSYEVPLIFYIITLSSFFFIITLFLLFLFFF